MDANQMLTYETLRFFVGPLLKMRLRLKIYGQENVPDIGAAVIVCNHRSAYDPAILAYSVRNRYINFGAASWSWEVPLYRQFHERLGAFPLTLTGGEKAETELSRGLELLEQGEIVGIFPEGGDAILSTAKVEKIGPFKTGFARLALQARVPVIPTAVIGAAERRLPTVPGPVVRRLVNHPDSGRGYSAVLYRRARCRIGVPLDLGEFYDEKIAKELLRLVSDKVREIVIKLYNGEDLDRFLTGEIPFDFVYERVGGPTGKLL